MAIILYLETSTKNCSVAIGNGTELLCLCEEEDPNYSHAEKLHTFVQWALEGANLKDVDAVCVAMGPGSYTGLRIGVSAAKGLCFALGIPLLAVNSLDILAETALAEANYEYVIPMIDARRNEVYTKVINTNFEEQMPTTALILDTTSYFSYRDKQVAVIGNGTAKAKDLLQWSSAKFLTEYASSAKFMLRLGEQKFQNGDFEDVAYFEPFYLKEFIIQKK